MGKKVNGNWYGTGNTEKMSGHLEERRMPMATEMGKGMGKK